MDWKDARPIDVDITANAKATIYFRADSNSPTRLLAEGSTGYSSPTVVTRSYISAGDTNGVFYYIGTLNATTTFLNPITRGKVLATSNSGALTTGTFPLLTDRTTGTLVGPNTVGSWISVELRGYELRCNQYSIRNTVANTTTLVNWQFQGSKDGLVWTVLDIQTNNTTIATASAWYNFTVLNNGYYRFFRILSTGKDSSGTTDQIAIGELELYGKLRVY